MQLLRSYLAARGRQEGITLAELMVVLVIISIIGMVSVGIMVSLFDSNIRSGQYLSQQQTIETYFGFMASRLAPVQRGQIGLPYCVPAQGQNPNQVCRQGSPTSPLTDPADPKLNNRCTEQAEEDGTCRTIIDPLSISGDQLVFRSNGYCYRVFYVEGRQEIRVAVTPGNCSGPTVPRRGPNQQGGSLPADEALDGMVNGSAKSFVLASRIVKNRPTNSPVDPDPLEAFYYYAASANFEERPNTDPVVHADPPGEIATGIPNRSATTQRPQSTSNLGMLHPFYQELANRGQIAYVKGYAYVAGVDNENARPRVSDRLYTQVFALNQVCDVEGTGDDRLITPGTLVEGGVVAANQTNLNYNHSINPGGSTVTPDKQLAYATQVAGQARLIEFTAQTGVKSGGVFLNPPAELTMSVILEKKQNGTWTETDDSNGNSRFEVSQGVPAASSGVVRVSGSFQVPSAVPGGPVDNWRIRVEIKHDSGSNASMTSAKQQTFLSYKVIADY